MGFENTKPSSCSKKSAVVTRSAPFDFGSLVLSLIFLVKGTMISPVVPLPQSQLTADDSVSDCAAVMHDSFLFHNRLQARPFAFQLALCLRV
jgi:hypothetical protein